MSSAKAVYILIFFVHEMSFLQKFYFDQTVIINCIQAFFIAELAERSSIIIQNSSNPSSRKNLDVRPYMVLVLTCVVNSTAGTPTPRLCSVVQWSVHWAPSRTTRVLVLAGARRCAFETCEKKNASSAFRLGLIYTLFTFESHSPFCFFTVLMLGLKRVLTLIFILFQRQAFLDSP